jgi:hydroxymethylglutaryl-CoA lyase
MGIANAYAAMQLGARDFDASVAGLGGCPFGGDHGAAGNIATEEFVHMCHEMGIDTGVDLDRLIDVALQSESIVGHPLPGKIMRGRALHTYR